MGLAASKNCQKKEQEPNDEKREEKGDEEKHDEEKSDEEEASTRAVRDDDDSSDSDDDDCTSVDDSSHSPFHSNYWEEEENRVVSKGRAPLSWRGEPEDTLSDWTIIVHCDDEEEEEQETFHVHRNMLALGERGCDYFATLFQSQFRETESNTSHIHLKQSDYSVFGDMLDYIYTGRLRMCHHKVMPLRSLARYFGNASLQKCVNNFLKQRLTSDTALYYLKEASAWKEESLFQSSLRISAERFFELDLDELLALPLDLFKAIVTCPDLGFCSNYTKPNSSCECDKRLSAIVMDYLKESPVDISIQDLVDLTDAGFMKRVDSEAASYLLDLAQDMEPETEDEQQRLALRDLCFRCWQSTTSIDLGIDSAKEYVQEYWDELDWEGRKLVMQLGFSLKEADEEVSRCEVRTVQLQEECDRLRQAKRRLQEECSNLRRTKRRLLDGDDREDVSDSEDDSEDDDGDY